VRHPLVASARLAAAGAALALIPAAAHVNTVSYPVFTFYEREARLDLRVKLADFTEIIAFAPSPAEVDGPPPLTEAAVRAKEAELVAVADGAVRLELNGLPAPGRFDGLDLTAAPSGSPPVLDSAVFHFRYASAAPIERVKIDYRLFAGHDPNHRGFAKLRAGTSERSLVLRASPPHEFTLDDLRRGATLETASSYFLLGMEHIVTGYDHLLFLAGLLLAATGLRPLFLVVTGFTIAHSTTLVLAALQVLTLPVNLVEPAIAASIAYVGVENLLRPAGGRARFWIASAFGLVHGLGFAGFVREVELPAGSTALALASFNVGVEAGQAAIVCVAFPILDTLRQRLGDERYRATVVKFGSAVLAVAGAALLVERVAG
jgi:hydrogenase/urease accessory protein HupE